MFKTFLHFLSSSRETPFMKSALCIWTLPVFLGVCWEHQAEVKICLFWVWLAVLRKVPLVQFQLYFLIYKPEFTWNYDGIMELWWNLDILWWNLDRFEHKFDGNITNWPCWSEGKLGTGPFTWLGQGFQTNFLEIPFQKGENLSIYGQNYGHLRSFTAF